MKIVSRIVLATMATVGLVFASSGPAAADHVGQHRHCLLTPSGWVPLAEGVSVEAFEQTNAALDQFHALVHRGQPASELTIMAIFDPNIECSDLPVPSAE